MKSSNGAGSIIKLKGKRRKPYAVRGKEYLDMETGKYKKPYIAYFETKKEAETFRAAYLANNEEITKQMTKKKEKTMTFEEVYTLWLDSKRPKESTSRNYTSYFNNSKKLHKIDLKNINGIMLQNIFNNLDLSSGTLRNLRSFWKMIFDFAVLNDFCTKNYAEHLTLPIEVKGKKTGDRKRIFTQEQLNILWKNIYKDKYKIIDIILIACYTGLRANELLNIKIENVNIEAQYIDIISSKTNAGIRQVPISNKVIDLVKKRYIPKNKFLFLRYDNEVYKYDAFDYHFRILMEELEFNYHTIHDCRHTFATMLSDLEIDKELIRKMMGHTNYKITSDVYIEKSIKKLVEAVNKF